MTHELTRARRAPDRGPRAAARRRAADRLRRGGRHLTLLQDDPCAAVAPSAHLVLWTPAGAAYDPPSSTTRSPAGASSSCTRCCAPPPTSRSTGPGWPTGRVFDELPRHPRRAGALDGGQRRHPPRHPREALRRGAGHLAGAARHHADAVALERLERRPQRADAAGEHGGRGEVAVAGYEGRDKLWDLAERVYPDDPVPAGGRAARARPAPAGARSASPDPRPRSCPANPPPSATPARRPWSRASAAGGGSTRRTSRTWTPSRAGSR